MTERAASLRFDLCFMLCALIFALLVHYAALAPESGGTRGIIGDAQQLAAFAAALDHPEAFSRDPLLADPHNFGWYRSVHVPLIRLLADGKDYGLAYAKLTGVHQFVHLTGFYLLGVCFLRRRFWAAVFSVLVSLEFWFGWGTFWGSLREGAPLPRVTYAALFSLLCAAMFTVRRNFRLWPAVFLGMGALVHVHAISALGMGFAMWLGLLHFRPEGFSRARHAAHMLAAGLCFLAPALPFIAHFSAYAAAGTLRASLAPEDLLFLREIAAYRIAETFTRLGPQLLDFLIQICTQPPLLPLALAGIWAVRRYGDARERDLLPMLGLWALGIVLTVAAFAADHEIAGRLGRPPLEYDMVRCVRFFPFFCFIAAFMGLSAAWGAGAVQARLGRTARFFPPALGLLTLTLFLLQGAVRPVLFLFLPSTESHAETLARERADGELIRALATRTEQGSKIFAQEGDYLTRFAALRNLAFSHKDGVILLYAKQIPALRTWYGAARALEDRQRLGVIERDVEGADVKNGTGGDGPATLVEYARRTDSDYLVLKKSGNSFVPPEGTEPVWSGSRHVLLRLPRD